MLLKASTYYSHKVSLTTLFYPSIAMLGDNTTCVPDTETHLTEEATSKIHVCVPCQSTFTNASEQLRHAKEPWQFVLPPTDMF